MKELIVLSSINRALVDSGEMQRQGILVDEGGKKTEEEEREGRTVGFTNYLIFLTVSKHLGGREVEEEPVISLNKRQHCKKNCNSIIFYFQLYPCKPAHLSFYITFLSYYLYVVVWYFKHTLFFPLLSFLWRKKMVLICLKLWMGKKNTDGKHYLEE